MYTRLGNQTITIISLSQTGRDELAATLTETRTLIPGCMHQPLRNQVAGGGGQARAQKTPEPGVTVASEWWQTHAPPRPEVLALKASDRLEYNGEVFQIISGVKPFTDAAGRVNHVWILSERQTIG